MPDDPGSPIQMPDTRIIVDGGDLNQEGVWYQNTYTCLLVLKMYLKEIPTINPLKEIFCEQVDDILGKDEEDKFICIQVKHRKNNFPFSLSDDEIKKSIRKFAHYEDNFSKSFSKFIVATNSGVRNDTKSVTIENVIRFCSGEDPKDKNKAERFVDSMKGEISKEKIGVIFAKLEFWNIPNLDTIEAVIVSEVLPKVPEVKKAKVSINNLKSIHSQIYALVTKKAKIRNNPEIIKRAFIEKDDNNLDRTNINLKTISIEEVREVIAKNLVPLQLGGVEKVNTQKQLSEYYLASDDYLINIRDNTLLNELNKFGSITKKPILLITGGPGIGKSWFSYRLLTNLFSRGYDIYKIISCNNFSEQAYSLMSTAEKPHVFCLDGRWLSLDERKTQISLNDIASLLMTFLPSGSSIPSLGPLVLTIKKDTWDYILKYLNEIKRITPETIKEIVEIISLESLDNNESHKMVKSFYEKVDNRKPRFPHLKVDKEVEDSIITRSEGIPVISTLFFNTLARSHEEEYRVTLEDTMSIYPDIFAYTLDNIFKYYFSADNLKHVFSLLYFLISKPVSIGHLKYLIENEFIQLLPKLKYYTFNVKPLPLFELDAAGFLVPYHSSFEDSIMDLMHNPYAAQSKMVKFNRELSQKIQFLMEAEGGIISILETSRQNFISKSAQSIIGCVNKSINDIRNEIKTYQTISDKTLYYLLSASIEFFELQNEADSVQKSKFANELEEVLSSASISYSEYKGKVIDQLFWIFRLLNWIENPKQSLKTYYIDFLLSKTFDVKYYTMCHLPELLKRNILQMSDLVQDLENFKDSIIDTLIKADTTDNKVLSSLLTPFLEKKVITKEDKETFREYLKSDNKDLRLSTWGSAPALITFKILSLEEIRQMRSYFLELLTSEPFILHSAWFGVQLLLETKILDLQDIEKLKVHFFRYLDSKDHKILRWTWFITFNLHAAGILSSSEKSSLVERMMNLTETKNLDILLKGMERLKPSCTIPKGNKLSKELENTLFSILKHSNLSNRLAGWITSVLYVKDGSVIARNLQENKSYFLEILKKSDRSIRDVSWLAASLLAKFGIISLYDLKELKQDLFKSLSANDPNDRWLAWHVLVTLLSDEKLNFKEIFPTSEIHNYREYLYQLPLMIKESKLQRSSWRLIDRYNRIFASNF